MIIPNSLNNKYTKWYVSICINAQNRPPIIGYKEVHHIVPKSIGGTNDKTNLVPLTPKEHFICHLLLCKMFSDKSIIRKCKYAIVAFSRTNQFQNRALTSHQYDLIRRTWSELNKGKIGPMKNKSHTTETKQKMSEKRKGKKHSQESKDKIANSKLGKTRPPMNVATKQKIGKSFSNTVYVTNGIIQLRVPPLEIPAGFEKGKLKIKCPHCNFISDKQNLARHIKANH